MCLQEHLTKALTIRTTLFGDMPSEDTASTMFNLGHLYNRLGGRHYVTKAIDLHERCLKMYKAMGGVRK